MWGRDKDSLFMLIVALVVIIVLSLAARTLKAHEWYDEECCSDEDCAPYMQTVIETETEYILPDIGFKINKQRVRPSRDVNYHACIVKSDYGSVLLCLYVPLWM